MNSILRLFLKRKSRLHSKDPKKDAQTAGPKSQPQAQSNLPAASATWNQYPTTELNAVYFDFLLAIAEEDQSSHLILQVRIKSTFPRLLISATLQSHCMNTIYGDCFSNESTSKE